MKSKEIFELSNCIKCTCFGNEKYCMCTNNEKVIRNYIVGNISAAMTAEQREYCISTADWSWQGAYKREEIELMEDIDLAKCLMGGWHDYASSQI